MFRVYTIPHLCYASVNDVSCTFNYINTCCLWITVATLDSKVLLPVLVFYFLEKNKIPVQVTILKKLFLFNQQKVR